MLDFRQSLINSSLRKVLKRLHYPLEVMLTCVRWYVAYQRMHTKMMSIGKRSPLVASIAFHTRRKKELSINEQAVRPPMRTF